MLFSNALASHRGIPDAGARSTTTDAASARRPPDSSGVAKAIEGPRSATAIVEQALTVAWY